MGGFVLIKEQAARSLRTWRLCVALRTFADSWLKQGHVNGSARVRSVDPKMRFVSLDSRVASVDVAVATQAQTCSVWFCRRRRGPQPFTIHVRISADHACKVQAVGNIFMSRHYFLLLSLATAISRSALDFETYFQTKQWSPSSKQSASWQPGQASGVQEMNLPSFISTRWWPLCPSLSWHAVCFAR